MTYLENIMFINTFNIIDIAILIKLIYMFYKTQRNPDSNFNEIGQAHFKVNMKKSPA